MTTKKFLIIGRSCVGKTSLSRAVCNRLGLRMVRSYTTRPMRASENPDISDHYFISPDEAKNYESNMAAYTEINGYQYFTTIDELNRCDVYVIDPIGVKDLRNRVGNKFEFIEIYIRVPKSVATRRSVQRGDTSFNERIAKEDEQFAKYEKDMLWDYHILNDRTFDEGVMKLERIIKSELRK